MDKLYIPGDFVSVYVGVKKYIVEVIGTENENEVLLYQIKFPNGVIQYADKDNIVPIPLTPEILEKNGWDKVVCRFLYCRKEFGTLTFRLFDEDYGWTLRCGNQNLIKKVEFVHELQHLLFGLGLNSEMEV